MIFFDYLYILYNLSLKLPAFCRQLKIDSVLRHIIIFLSSLILLIYFEYTRINKKIVYASKNDVLP